MSEKNLKIKRKEKDKEIQVYFRRNQDIKSRLHYQFFKPDMVDLKNIAELKSNSFIYESQSDLDVSIALRKSVLPCSQHPISNFVS